MGIGAIFLFQGMWQSCVYRFREKYRPINTVAPDVSFLPRDGMRLKTGSVGCRMPPFELLASYSLMSLGPVDEPAKP